MTNTKCCKISESKKPTQANKVNIKMKKRKNSNNKRKLVEQGARLNDLKMMQNKNTSCDIIHVYLS